jgi:hypothetical protein
MERWRARVRVGDGTLEVTVDEDGRINPGHLEVLRDDAIRRGLTVGLTATGPEVPLTVDDRTAVLRWLLDTFPLVEVIDEPDWPADPRTVLPDGALG